MMALYDKTYYMLGTARSYTIWPHYFSDLISYDSSHIHTTLYWPPCCAEHPTHASGSRFLSCYPLCQKHTSPRYPHGSWLMAHSFTSFRYLLTCRRLRCPPHQNLQPHIQSRHSPVSFPCYAFLHSNYHLLTNYQFSVD